MNPLAVTAFFDIGRGSWESLSRSGAEYVGYYRHYLARLPIPRYLLATAEVQRAVSETVQFSDEADLGQLPCYRFLERTQQVMDSAEFRSLFDSNADQNHLEHKHAEYNIVMMSKWDALERAAALTNGDFSHYAWLDFGLGHGPVRPYLPPPIGFSPIDRDRIVLSAQARRSLRSLKKTELARRIERFVEQVAGSIMIVPADLLPAFCDLARRNYERLLDMNLTADDQVVIDMCVAERPELFHLSFAPIGLTKFNNVHNVINGLDLVQPRTWKIPLYDQLTRRSTIRLARKRIGL